MINEYEIKMNKMMEYMLYFNNEKLNYNNIYKYRIIYSMLIGNDENVKKEKNDKILDIMENINIDKNKENIKNDFFWILNNNKLKELIISLNKYNFVNKFNKIIETINLNNINNQNTSINGKKKLENIINKIVINNKYKTKKYINKNNTNNCIIPGFNNQIKNISSSGKNKNTSASSLGNNNIIALENENDSSYNNHKNNGVINFEYTFCKKDFKLNPSNHSKSTNDINYNDNKNNDRKICVYEKKKIRHKSTDFIYNIKKINLPLNNNTTKLNENILQNSINDTKINFFQKRKYRNDDTITNNNIISDKTQRILNKTFLYDYKGFNINDKDSGPELLNNTSSVVQGVKYVSNSYRNKSYDNLNNLYDYFTGKRKKYVNLKSHSIGIRNNNNTFFNDKIDTYNNYNNNNLNNKYNNNSNLFKLSRNVNNRSNSLALVQFYKPKKNYSVENINNKKIISKSFVNNTMTNNNQYNNNFNNKYSQLNINQNNENSIYIHKKFITLDISKSLSSIDSITSSILSSTSSNKNIKGETNNIFLNEINKDTNITNNNMIKNKTLNINKLKVSKLYIGLILGNSECKIGFLKNNNTNYYFANNNNDFLTIPSMISFISNNSNNHNIKIGEDAEKLKISNASQTIFNIIKLFGKDTNEIIDKKDLWPFNIYKDSKSLKPYIKITYSNSKIEKKNKYFYYNFEDILAMYLKKVFQIFFNKLKYNNLDNKENYYNMNTSKYIDINIDINIGVPNYFNYLQRELIKKIFITKIFSKKEINNKNIFKIKSNIYGSYNIQLNDIKIENSSNLASFYLLDKNVNNNSQKFSKNYLILYVDGDSVNISITNISRNNNNYYMEIKSINNEEFGDEDFLDNFIHECLSDFKDKIKYNCLNSPTALARIRKSLSNAKISFDKEEMNQIEININKLYGSLDLKMSINRNIYYKSCMGLFKKIILLIKDTISNSKIEIEDINDIILIGNITQNIKLKNMISDLFKDNNKIVYNKLINKNNENDNDINNYIIKGAIMQCFNNSMTIPKYKLINITHHSFGIESLNGLMDIVIEKGSNIPIKFNKYIKIKKPDINQNNMVNINIYEGESKFVKNNKLMANNLIDIKNLNMKKKMKIV